jgi:hypothetical protein
MGGGGERFGRRGRGEVLRLPFCVDRLRNRGRFCVLHYPYPTKRVRVQASQGWWTGTCLEELMEENAGPEYVREVVGTPVLEEGEIGELVIDGEEVVFRVLVVDWGDWALYGWMVLGGLDGRVDDVLGRGWALPGREEEPAATRHATQLSFPAAVTATRTDLSVNWTRGWQFGGGIAAGGPGGGVARWLALRG